MKSRSTGDSDWTVHERCAEPPTDYHNQPRHPTFGELVPQPLTWDQFQAQREKQEDQ